MTLCHVCGGLVDDAHSDGVLARCTVCDTIVALAECEDTTPSDTEHEPAPHRTATAAARDKP